MTDRERTDDDANDMKHPHEHASEAGPRAPAAPVSRASRAG